MHHLLRAILVSLPIALAAAEAHAVSDRFACMLSEGFEVEGDGKLRPTDWTRWILNAEPELKFDLDRNVLRHYGSPTTMTLVQGPAPNLDIVAVYSSPGARITWSRILRIRSNLENMPFIYVMDDAIFSGNCRREAASDRQQSEAIPR